MYCVYKWLRRNTLRLYRKGELKSYIFFKLSELQQYALIITKE